MEGGDEGRATREEASKDMIRGTHLTDVHPALFVRKSLGSTDEADTAETVAKGKIDLHVSSTSEETAIVDAITTFEQ